MRRRLGLVLLALGVSLAVLVPLLLVTSSQRGQAARSSSTAPAVTAPGPTPKLPSGSGRARALAALFMTQLESRDYTAQWQELAPEAQAQWPSAVSRAAMLLAKFSGPGAIASFRIGRTRSRVTWTSPESPTVSVTNAYSVRVSIAFARPATLQPVGVANDYQGLTITLALTSVSAPGQIRHDHNSPLVMKIVGEGPASLDAPIIVPSQLVARSSSVPILMYHLVGPFPNRAVYANVNSYILDYDLTVTPTAFAQEVSYLVQNGYTSISLNRLSDALLYGLPLPTHPVVLTFDDGFLNEWQYAVPVLQQARYTAVFFPCSGIIGQTLGHESYMTAAELADLARSGYWVEDHTYNDGTSLWGRSPAEMELLAGASAHTLEAITKQPIQFIAYTGLWPYKTGTQVEAPEQELFSELPGLGYVAGLEDLRLPASPWLETSSTLWELPRIRAFDNESLPEFASILHYG
ncbi:MAG: polysaccharide deacetylase family protein [Candidatus Dormiibacterota bacterium]